MYNTNNMAKKILVIEDDNFLQGLIARKLSNEDFTVSSAGDNKETFDILAKETPDLILLDLLLPEVDGFEILKKIRESESWKNIPVLVFSNLSGENDIKKAQGLGIEEYMIKSNFTLDELLEKVNKLLK